MNENSSPPSKPLAGFHVVMVPAWWPTEEQPGAGTFFRDYAQLFAAAGAKVGVIFPDLVSIRYLGKGRHIPLFPRLIEESLPGGVNVIRVRGLHTAMHLPAIQMARFLRWLERGLKFYADRHGEPDLLHAMCSIPSGWACTRLPGDRARPVVVTEVTGPFSMLFQRESQGRYVRDALAMAGAIVAPGTRSRQEMCDAGISQFIEVIGNPVADAFTTAALPNKKRGPVSRGLFVGRLVPEKGIEDLVEAAGRMAGKCEAEFHIIGEGPLRSTISARSRTLNVAPHFHLHGHCERPKVIALMQQSDFLVLPTHAETFGLAAAEALCMGLPVVTTRGTGCGDLIGPDDGTLVEIGDPTSLAEGIRRLIENLDRYDRAAIASRSRGRFAGIETARRYSDIYRRVSGKQEQRAL